MNIEKELKPKYLPFIYSHTQWKDKVKPLVQKLSASDNAINSIKLLQVLYQVVNGLSNDQQNTHRKIDKPSYKSFYSEYSQILPKLLRQVSSIVLEAENRQLKICLLYSGSQAQVTLGKKDVLFLICLMVLNLTCLRHQQFVQFPGLQDFSWILSQQQFKTKTLIQYLKIELSSSQKSQSKQMLTIKRTIQKRSIQQMMKRCSKFKMANYQIKTNKQSIEQFYGHLKVDFANQYIGGGALMGGLVQQEIMFANHPQMYVSVLICQKMQNNQSINFSGFKKYWSNSGYSYTCTFQGPDKINYQIDKNKHLKQYITAIDATCYFRQSDPTQFTQQAVNRQILKAVAGFEFQELESRKIVTGNWGCGAFNGNVELKFIIQWIACTITNKQLIYCPFGQQDLFIQNKDIIEKLALKNLQDVYQTLFLEIAKVQKSSQQIFKILNEIIK